MAWVHCECLNTWRQQSVNPRSFFQCDTCKVDYRFATAMGPDRFTIARILAWPMFIHFLSILGLFALCNVCGFVAKMFNSSLTWLDVFRCFNINHLLSGATATGLLSLFGWLTAAGGLGDGLRVMDIWRGGTGGNGGGTAASVLLVLAVVAGLCLALYWIYGRLEELSRQTVRMAQQVVLDAGADVGGGDDGVGGEALGCSSGGGEGAAHRQGQGDGDDAGAQGELPRRRVFKFVD